MTSWTSLTTCALFWGTMVSHWGEKKEGNNTTILSVQRTEDSSVQPSENTKHQRESGECKKKKKKENKRRLNRTADARGGGLRGVGKKTYYLYFVAVPCSVSLPRWLCEGGFFCILYATLMLKQVLNNVRWSTRALPFKAYACIGHAGLFTVTSMVDPCAHGIRVDAFGTNEGTYSQGAITIVDRAQVLM